MYHLCAKSVADGYQYTVTDAGGRVVDVRTTPRVYRGAVVALSEMSERASVWSWHATTEAAQSAAATLRRKRPEILVDAVVS